MTDDTGREVSGGAAGKGARGGAKRSSGVSGASRMDSGSSAHPSGGRVAGPPSKGSAAGPGPAAAGGVEGGLLDVLAPRRGLRLVVTAVVLLEALALLIATAFLVGELVLSAPTDVGGEVTQALITLVVGAGLVQLGRIVLRADERARIPVLVWQALQASVAIPALSSRPLVGVALLLPAVVAGGGVLVPGVLRPDVRGLSRD